MTTRSIALVGSTGLVGRECLKFLLGRPEFSRVVVLVRRQVQIDLSPAHREKVELHVVDFDRLASYAGLLAVDQILCALGTTIRKAGSQQAFRTVDFAYPAEIARLGLERGARHFLLVSAVGANARSSVFYNRVKGELENAVLALPYRAHTIVRPSLLLGEREETRLGEKIGEKLAFLAPRKYKPVHARDVAWTLVNAAFVDGAGVNVIESQQIQRAHAAGA
jgi:uncharacterized protein YbjT (DUF2867 family)